jgi:hypothetical protein
MTLKLILKPHPETSTVIEIRDEEYYPITLVNIETFWIGGIGEDRRIYEALAEGETVKVELRMVIDPCLDPQ